MLSGDLSGPRQINKGIDIHFGMNSQILKVRLGNKRSDRIRHTADAQLEAGTIRNLIDDHPGNLFLYLGRFSGRSHLSYWRIVSFYNIINIGDMDVRLKSSKYTRHVFIYFDNHLVGCLAYCSHVGSIRSEIEVSMLVHRSHLKYRYVYVANILPVIARKF